MSDLAQVWRHHGKLAGTEGRRFCFHDSSACYADCSPPALSGNSKSPLPLVSSFLWAGSIQNTDLHPPQHWTERETGFSAPPWQASVQMQALTHDYYYSTTTIRNEGVGVIPNCRGGAILPPPPPPPLEGWMLSPHGESLATETKRAEKRGLGLGSSC